MEFDERNCSPEIRNSWLYQQVVDQSDICDVTIQVGEWRKRFHWCILVTSPYFESLRRNNFAEIQKGMIELNVASPLDTDIAILYLYGKKPRLSEDNIASILELAEFLMIPNLKSLCVRYIKHTAISSENCLNMLQLSCRYDFELTRCHEYLQRHMVDVLQTKEATCLTKGFVIETFTDPHFENITAEEKFIFLIRWANECQANEEDFPEVFESICLTGMDKEFLGEEVMQNPLIQGRFDKTFLKEHCNCEGHKVVIFSDSSGQAQLTCFDLHVRKWFNLDICEPHDPDLLVKGIGNRYALLPVVYKVDNCYGNCTVYKHILSIHKHTFVSDVKVVGHSGSFSNYCVHGNTFAAVVNKTVSVKRLTDRNETDTTETVFLAGEGNSHSKPIVSMINKPSQPDIVRYSTLFCAKVKTSSTKLLPVLTIPGTTIDSCCLNPRNSIALFSENNQSLYIYDKIRCEMNVIWLGQDIEFDGKYRNVGVLQLVPAGRDFILYNRKQATIVSRCPGRWGNERYAIRKVELEYDEHWGDIEYFYCDDVWFRFLRRTPASEMEFSSVTHIQLLEGNGKNLPWKELPITEEIGHLSRGNQAFALRLHPSLLGKHLNCPQCENLKGAIMTPLARSVGMGDYVSDIYESSDDEDGNDLWHDEDSNVKKGLCFSKDDIVVVRRKPRNSEFGGFRFFPFSHK